MLADLKRNAEAIDVFTALTEDFPELPDPYNNLAVLHAAEGQLQSALVALQTALRNDPTHRAARENLGDVHLALAVQRLDRGAGRAPRATTPGCAASCSWRARSRPLPPPPCRAPRPPG